MSNNPNLPQIYTGGMVQTNAWLFNYTDGSLLFDAPAGSYNWVKEQQVHLKALLLTHQHFDHIEDARFFYEDGIPVYAFAELSSEFTLIDEMKMLSLGLPSEITHFEIKNTLGEQPEITFGDEHFSLLHVPGHSPDSLVFYSEKHDFLIAGDTLMAGSIGRSDFPGGSHERLVQGIQSRLFSLPDSTYVLSGHGPATTIEREKKSNPFVKSL